MKLQDYGEALAYETAFFMQGQNDPDYPIQELGELCLSISTKLRSLAIFALLINADIDNFYHNLIRSGKARETYLRRIHDTGIIQDHHFASGRYQPILDAIAANDFDLGKQIVALSPSEWQKGHEYEEDYLYSLIIHNLILESSPFEDISALIDRYDVCCISETANRGSLTRALLLRDQNLFEQSFEELLDFREREISADKARAQMEEPEIMANRYVFIEGLAILRLAERCNLATFQEYRFCPALARIPMLTPYKDLI